MLLIGFVFGGQGMIAGLFATPPNVVQEAAIINLPQVYSGGATGDSGVLVPDTGGEAQAVAGVPCPLPEGWIPYTVNPTDSLFRLSVMHGITVEEIRRVNCLGEEVVIMPSDVIYVPRVVSATITPFAANVFPNFTPGGGFQASNQVPVSQPDDEEEDEPAPPPPPTAPQPVVEDDPTQPPAATEPPPPPRDGDDDDRGGRGDDDDDDDRDKRDDDDDKDKDKDEDKEKDKDKDKDKGGKGGGKGKD